MKLKISFWAKMSSLWISE